MNTSGNETILQYLREQKNPSAVEAIASATDLSPATVRRTLGRLVKDGFARKAGGGKFTAAANRHS